jgi:GNAT superfamily N-acetyltransferase
LVIIPLHNFALQRPIHRMNIRRAQEKDLDQIIAMLADDKLGAKRENYISPLPRSYHNALDRILKDSNQWLMVVESMDGRVIGTCQLTLIPYLTYQGGVRAQVEGVRIHKENRGEGLGKKMIQWAIDKAIEEKAHVIQLTTDKQRPESIVFYENLGFVASHAGMKKHL